MYVGILLAFYAGLRRGEICGLRWNDIDFYKHTITVRSADEREVVATEDKLTGFIFKIQANMDPKHHDRIAFMRVVSGAYKKGMKLYNVRLGREMIVSDAVTFLAGERM